jgi:CRISPR-associated protein Csd2
MEEKKMPAINNRYDFIMLFDCTDGNPNGDPDAGNMPRIDPETNQGLVTDVCLKRKIRNYVAAVKDDEPGFKIYISDDALLNTKDNEAYKYLGIEFNEKDDEKRKEKIKRTDPLAENKIKEFMCKNFYDIRTFGAVMTTFVKDHLNCGQVTGPVQISFARSIDPVYPQEFAITRKAITAEKDADKTTEFGRKTMIPYGLYRAEGFISAHLAQKVTDFSEEDLELLWQAIINMFDMDHSAARGKMALRELIVFKHDSALGAYPSHKLFETVKVQKKEGVEYPRSYSDYTVEVLTDNIPDSVSVERKI